MTLHIDLNEIVNGKDKQTNFGTMLLKLVFKADSHNKENLRKGFPNAVTMVEAWSKNGEILDLPYD